MIGKKLANLAALSLMLAALSPASAATPLREASGAAGRILDLVYSDDFSAPDLITASLFKSALARFDEALSGIGQEAVARSSQDERRELIAAASYACMAVGRWAAMPERSASIAAEGLVARALSVAKRLARLLPDDAYRKRLLESEYLIHLESLGARKGSQAAPGAGEDRARWEAAFAPDAQAVVDLWSKLKKDPWYSDYYDPFLLSKGVALRFRRWLEGQGRAARAGQNGLAFATIRFMYDELGFRLRYDYSSDSAKTTKFAQGAEYLCKEYETRGFPDGDCLSGAFLFCALYREAGGRACVARVVAGEDGKYLPDHFSVAVDGGSAAVFFDVGMGIADFRPVEARPLSDSRAVLENLRFTEPAQYEALPDGRPGTDAVNAKYDLLLALLPDEIEVFRAAVNSAKDNMEGQARKERLEELLRATEARAQGLAQAGPRSRTALRASRAVLLRDLGRAEEAMEVVREGETEAAGCPDFYFQAYELAALLRLFDEAERYAKLAVDSSSGYVRADASKAWTCVAESLCARGGGPEDAKRAWLQVANCGDGAYALAPGGANLRKLDSGGRILSEILLEPVREDLGGGASVEWPIGARRSFAKDGSETETKSPGPLDLSFCQAILKLGPGTYKDARTAGSAVLNGFLAAPHTLSTAFGSFTLSGFGDFGHYDLRLAKGLISGYIPPTAALRLAGQAYPLPLSPPDAKFNIAYREDKISIKLGGPARIAVNGADLLLSDRFLLEIKGQDLAMTVEKGSSLRAGGLLFELGAGKEDPRSIVFKIDKGSLALYAEFLAPAGIPVEPGASLLPDADRNLYNLRASEDAIELALAEGSSISAGWLRSRLRAGSSPGINYLHRWDSRGVPRSATLADPLLLRLGPASITCPPDSVVEFDDQGRPRTIRCPAAVDLGRGIDSTELNVDDEGRVESALISGEARIATEGGPLLCPPFTRVHFREDGRPAALTLGGASRASLEAGVLRISPSGYAALDDSGAIASFDPAWCSVRFRDRDLELYDPVLVELATGRTKPFDAESAQEGIDLATRGLALEGALRSGAAFSQGEALLVAAGYEEGSRSRVRLSAEGLWGFRPGEPAKAGLSSGIARSDEDTSAMAWPPASSGAGGFDLFVPP